MPFTHPFCSGDFDIKVGQNGLVFGVGWRFISMSVQCMQDYKCLCGPLTIYANFFYPKLYFYIVTLWPRNVSQRKSNRKWIWPCRVNAYERFSLMT